MMAEKLVLYICPRCFQALDTEPDEHEHHIRFIRCEPGEPHDDRRKPPTDHDGCVITRAPRWYLEAIGIDVAS